MLKMSNAAIDELWIKRMLVSMGGQSAATFAYLAAVKLAVNEIRSTGRFRTNTLRKIRVIGPVIGDQNKIVGGVIRTTAMRRRRRVARQFFEAMWNEFTDRLHDKQHDRRT